MRRILEYTCETRDLIHARSRREERGRRWACRAAEGGVAAPWLRGGRSLKAGGRDSADGGQGGGGGLNVGGELKLSQMKELMGWAFMVVVGGGGGVFNVK